MNNRAALIVVVLAALAALFFLLGGAQLFGDFTDAGEGGDSTADGGTLTAEGDGGQAQPDTAEAPSRGPVLFGRPRAERVGKGSLSGRVLDFESSEPIAQANVVLAGTGYGGETTAVQATTNVHGFFRYDDVPAGDGYGLHVTDAKQRERTVGSLVVDAGGEKDVGILWIGKASALEGTVLDASGLPIAEADVGVHEGGGSLMQLLRNLPKLMEVMDRDALPHARTRSARTGRFVFEQLSPGPYTLVVRAPGYLLTTRKIVMTSNGAAGGRVEIRMGPGSAIVGVVVDDRDRPIQGARVAVMLKQDMESVFFGRQYSETDAEGRFRIESPPTESSLVAIVTAEGYPRLFTEATPGAGELRFVLRGGVDVLLRVLEKGTDLPVEGASLMAMFAKKLDPGGGKGTFASGITDHRGEARFLAPPGKLQMLFLSHEGRGSGMYSPMMGMMGQALVLEGPKDTTVKAPRTELVFHMAAGITLRGTVKDQDGKPLVGARVSTIGLMGAGGTTMSGEGGTYELEGQSPPIIMVTASLPGYVQAPSGLGGMRPGAGTNPGGIEERNVVMRRAASIAGRVVDEQGRALPGVEVRVGGGAGMGILAQFTGGKQTITNASGRYVLDGILPGPKMHVMAHSAGYLDSKTAAFEVGVDVAQAPDLVMHRGSRIVVQVETPDGMPLEGARVEVSVSAKDRIVWDLMKSFQGFADVVTNAAGKASVDDLPDGSVTLTATAKGFSAARETVATQRADGAKHEVVLRLREAVTLSGRVVDEDGKALAGAVVQTLPRQAEDGAGDPVWVPRVSATTAADGRFALENLPAAALQVAVTAEGHKALTRTVEAGGGEIEIRLAKVDADVQKRIEAIDAALQEISAQFADVKDEAERSALLQRMMQLRQEKANLESGAPKDR